MRKLNETIIILLIITGVFAIFGGVVCYKYLQAERTVAECNRLIGEYRERDAEVARINRELTDRNKRLEEGLGSIRDIAGTATGNLRQAISIISGVKSVLEKMEDDSYSRSPGYIDRGGNSGRVDSEVIRW